MLIEITRPDGSSSREDVRQVQFVKNCPHCGEEFLTCDPDHKYPTRSHRSRASEQRKAKRGMMRQAKEN